MTYNISQGTQTIEAKQDQIKTVLVDIHTAVSDLELSADNINLNTDELEGKLDDLITLTNGSRLEDGHGSTAILPSHTTDDADEFWRIENKRYKSSEEIRFDIPKTSLLPNSSIYVGVAPDSSLASADAWTIIRTYINNDGIPERKRIRFGMIWDLRTTGW